MGCNSKTNSNFDNTLGKRFFTYELTIEQQKYNFSR